MANWVTHLILADRLLDRFPDLHRRGFCVGNIAPDCNIENADFTAFTPPREVTHWMCGEKKQLSDCEGFVQAQILPCDKKCFSDERYAFLLGYYAHLVTDAAFQQMIRDERRVAAMWRRIRADKSLQAKALGLPETFDAAKKLLDKVRRNREIESMEAEYLQTHPDSGYLTEILPLRDFPDYLDYLPPGCIVRKIGVMGYTPQIDEALPLIALSREEWNGFLEQTVARVAGFLQTAARL